MSGYVNLSCEAAANVAQIHPHRDGIAFVLRSRQATPSLTLFIQIPVASLTGYVGPNARWLDGRGDPYHDKGPAIAYLIPDGVGDMPDGSPPWREIARLLEHAKTLV